MAKAAFTIDISDAINGIEKLKKRAKGTGPLMDNIAGHLFAGVEE